MSDSITRRQPDSDPKPPAARPWGLYTLANDAVLDSFLALAGSLLEFAPHLPLAVIPFDDRQSRLAPLVERLGASYFVPPELAVLDRLGERFYSDHRFHARGFRKLAAFFGPCERFVFLDSDVVALSPLAGLCAAIERADPALVYFDIDLDQVYRSGAFRDDLVARHGARGFNAGLFAARRSALDLARLESSLADLGADWRERLVPNAEQPFLNLYADRSGLAPLAAHELMPGYCSTCWPAAGVIEPDGTGFRLDSPERWDHGWRLFFAHWAGFSPGPAMPNRAIHDRFVARATAFLRLASGETGADLVPVP